MERFKTIEDPSGNPELEKLYGEIVGSGFGVGGRPIRWFTAQAIRPDLLAATWALVRGVLAEGQLPATLKQLMTLAISAQNGCRYCAETHRGALEALGIDRAIAERAAEDPTLADFPPAYRAAVAFGCKAAREPGALTDDDYAALRAAGYSDGEVLEIVMVAAYTNFTNTWADAGKIPLDTPG